MPFTFKLSKRLAVMKSAGTLALLAGLSSCEYPSKFGPHQISYVVTTMLVVPQSITLQPAQSGQFTAYGRTQAGDSVPITVTWTAPGGTISPSGVYTAPLLDGDYPAIAALVPSAAIGAPSGILQRSSVVHVRSLAQIVVVPKNVTVQTGGTQQFTAYGRLSSGDSVAVSVTWVATGGAVSSSGLYTTGSAPGGYVVSASASGITGSATVTATTVPVASVVVSPTTANVSVSGTAQLSATPKDATGNVLTGRTVTWTSANPAVATVSTAGLVTGVAVGSTTITATSEGISAAAAISVANLPVASVVVSPATPNIYIGGTVQLTATPKDATGTPLTGRVVTWTTSNSAVATVSASGLVTGVAVGVATITATSEGQSGTAAVTVSSVPVASVVVSPAAANILVAGTAQLSATPKDAAGNVLTGRAVTWTSANPAIATVSTAGLVTGVAVGSTTIIATSEGISASAAISVANVPVASVVISPVTAAIFVGATVQLTATLKDAAGNVLSGRSITWASSAPAVATVSSTGLVTGVAASAVTITATSEGQTGSAAVTVNLVPVASVSVAPVSALINVGQTVQLTATPRDANGTPLTGRLISWTSSAPAVATVSAGGFVMGIATGNVTITATSEGKSGTSAITVQAPPPGSHTGYFVTPGGSPSGDGSVSRPWDLQTALNQPAAVHPGDTLWLRGGTYGGQFTSRLNGTATSPIVVRQYPGERATLDGGNAGYVLIAGGSYTWFWGFEVTSSSPQTSLPGGGVQSYTNSVSNKFINLVIHDTPGQGIANFNWGQQQPEIYGSLSYNNGLHSNLDHGFYLNNNVANGTFYVTDNIIFNNLALGLCIYGSAGDNISGFDVEGNVAFDNGSIDVPINRDNEILIGGGIPASRIVASNNFTYWVSAPPNDYNRFAADLGQANSSNVDVVAQNNYIVGGFHVGPWASATVTGNATYDYAGQLVQTAGSVSGHVWSVNTFYGDPTAAVWAYNSTPYAFPGWVTATGLSNPGSYASSVPPNAVFVRPNKYEAGRANIIIYNWANLATVNVDLSGVLSGGQSYVIRNVQNFFGTPVVSGTYMGGTVSIPMAGIPAPVPIGRGQPGPVTGPTFNVFVVQKTP
jgi:uncharacterized protein YjdB